MNFAEAFALATSKPVNPDRADELRPLIAGYLLPAITSLQMHELVDAVVILLLLGIRTGRYMEKL